MHKKSKYNIIGEIIKFCCCKLISPSLGQSLETDINIAPNFDTSYMENSEHWTSSQMALECFEKASENGFLILSYDKTLNEEYNKVWLIYDDAKGIQDENYGKYIYVIGGDKAFN